MVDKFSFWSSVSALPPHYPLTLSACPVPQCCNSCPVSRTHDCDSSLLSSLYEQALSTVALRWVLSLLDESCLTLRPSVPSAVQPFLQGLFQIVRAPSTSKKLCPSSRPGIMLAPSTMDKSCPTSRPGVSLVVQPFQKVLFQIVLTLSAGNWNRSLSAMVSLVAISCSLLG